MSRHVLHSFVIYIHNVYNSSVGIIKKLMDFYTTLIICLMSSSSCMVIWFCFLEEICVIILFLSLYLFLAELVTELLQVKLPFLFLHNSSHFVNNTKKSVHWTFKFTNFLREPAASPSEDESSAFLQNIDNFLSDCTMLDCRMPFSS